MLQEGLDRASFVPSEEEWWRRSQLITSCHNLWDWTQSSRDCCLRKSWPAQSGPDLQNPLDLCCFSQALFFSPVIYIFIRADRSLTSFNFFFFPLSASCKRMSSNVPYSAARDFGRWEICWGSTLIWKCGHKFCLCRFHSLIVTSTPLPCSASTLLL